MSPRISIRLLSAQSDQRLLALAREGHERAFEALVHRYRRPLMRYAGRMRLSEARAEDVLQQAFMQSWLALSRGVEVRDVRGWLYRIVHNTAVNAMRGAPTVHAELTQAVQDRAGLRVASNLERRIAIHDALGHVAELPDMQRQAIFLTAVDGQSHEEVAGTLGISTGALRGLLYRARHTLRSAAAALTPQPLLELAARGGGEAAAPSAERIAELAGAGAGAAGLAGLLLKGGAAVLTAGALATGAGVIAAHGHRARPVVRALAASQVPAAHPSVPRDGAVGARSQTIAVPARPAPHRRRSLPVHPVIGDAGVISPLSLGPRGATSHDQAERVQVSMPGSSSTDRPAGRNSGGRFGHDGEGVHTGTGPDRHEGGFSEDVRSQDGGEGSSRSSGSGESSAQQDHFPSDESGSSGSAEMSGGGTGSGDGTQSGAEIRSSTATTADASSGDGRGDGSGSGTGDGFEAPSP